MTSNHRHNHYIHGWLEKIEANIAKFKQQVAPTEADQLEFISHQYHLVMLIHRVLNGQVIFAGAKAVGPIDEPLALATVIPPAITRTRRSKRTPPAVI